MYISISEKVKILLNRKKMTIGELADATGQTRQNLSNKFSRNNFSEKDILKIADALGCKVEIKFIFPDGIEV